MKWVLMMLGGMACGLAIRYSIATTPSIQGERSIAALEKISIGGVDQWLLMRSAGKSFHSGLTDDAMTVE